MTCDPTDGGAPAEIPARFRSAKSEPHAESPLKTLDALAVEMGRLAAERDFAQEANEDKADPDGLSSPQGESVQ